MIREHEYEPGDVYGKMHTDPMCKVCGLSKHNSCHTNKKAGK